MISTMYSLRAGESVTSAAASLVRLFVDRADEIACALTALETPVRVGQEPDQDWLIVDSLERFLTTRVGVLEEEPSLSRIWLHVPYRFQMSVELYALLRMPHLPTRRIVVNGQFLEATDALRCVLTPTWSLRVADSDLHLTMKGVVLAIVDGSDTATWKELQERTSLPLSTTLGAPRRFYRFSEVHDYRIPLCAEGGVYHE